MDIELLALLILNNLYIFGFHNATQHGFIYHPDVHKAGYKIPDPNDKEILWFIRWYLRNAPAWIKNPVFDCVVCMASFHGWPFFLFYELTLLNGATYIIYIFALSGFNKFVHDRFS